MLDVRCPGCAKLLQVANTATDRESVCPACGVVFRPQRVVCDPAMSTQFLTKNSTGIASTVAPEVNCTQPGDFHVCLNSRSTSGMADRAARWRVNYWQRARRGAAIGALLALAKFLAMADQRFRLVDALVSGCLICASTTLIAIAIGIIRSAPQGAWQRRRFFSATAVALGLLVVVNLCVMNSDHPRAADLSVHIPWVLLCGSIGLGLYLMLWIANRVASVIQQLGKVLLKAARRPTGGTRPADPCWRETSLANDEGTSC